MHSHSKLQKTVASSSGLAEFLSLSAGGEELVGFSSVFEFIGYTVDAELLSDSAAARGIALRSGGGGVKHIATRSLWLQDVIKRKIVRLSRCLGTQNPADLGTKPLPRATLVRMREANGIEVDGAADNSNDGEKVRTVSVLNGPLSHGLPSQSRLAAIVMAVSAALGAAAPAGGTEAINEGTADIYFDFVSGAILTVAVAAILALGMHLGSGPAEGTSAGHPSRSVASQTDSSGGTVFVARAVLDRRGESVYHIKADCPGLRRAAVLFQARACRRCGGIERETNDDGPGLGRVAANTSSD